LLAGIHAQGLCERMARPNLASPAPFFFLPCSGDVRFWSRSLGVFGAVSLDCVWCCVVQDGWMDGLRGRCFETACGFMGVSVLRLVGYLPHPHTLFAVSVRMLQAADEHRILSMKGQVCLLLGMTNQVGAGCFHRTLAKFDSTLAALAFDWTNGEYDQSLFTPARRRNE
jgi:hypothetical protein